MDKVDDWVWELVPPIEGTVPIEQRRSIPQKESDRIYFQRLQDNGSAILDPLSAGQERGIDIRGSGEEYSEETIKAHFLGEELAEKWRENTRKDRQYALNHGARVRGKETPGDKIKWTDEESKSMKRIEARKRIFHNEYAKAGVTIKAVGLHSGTQPMESTSESDKKSETYRRHLDSDFPEWRQPKQEAALPFSLRDPRRREVGYNYGLPKQKKLLKAANARDYDQEPWECAYQPCTFIYSL